MLFRSKAVAASDVARALSPYDPMLFAFTTAKVFSMLRLGRFDEAAELATAVINQPNAHCHCRAVCALAFAAAGRNGEAKTALAGIRRERPGYGLDDLLSAFRLGDDLDGVFRGAARRASSAFLETWAACLPAPTLPLWQIGRAHV